LGALAPPCESLTLHLPAMVPGDGGTTKGRLPKSLFQQAFAACVDFGRKSEGNSSSSSSRSAQQGEAADFFDMGVPRTFAVGVIWGVAGLSTAVEMFAGVGRDGCFAAGAGAQTLSLSTGRQTGFCGPFSETGRHSGARGGRSDFEFGPVAFHGDVTADLASRAPASFQEGPDVVFQEP
jgi:hypothetical protein